MSQNRVLMSLEQLMSYHRRWGGGKGRGREGRKNLAVTREEDEDSNF